MFEEYPEVEVVASMIITYQYRPLIHAEVLPTVDTFADKNSDTYSYFRSNIYEELRAGRRTVIDDRSHPEKVETEFHKETAELLDHALTCDIPVTSIERAPSQLKLFTNRIATTVRALKIQKEQRAAAFYKNAANYLYVKNDLKMTDDGLYETVRDFIRQMYLKPNTLVIGETNYDQLITNKSLIQVVQRDEQATKGVLTKQEIADLFGVDRVVVGESRLNFTPPGKKGKLLSIWDDVFSFVYLDPDISSTEDAIATFAFSTFGDPVQDKWLDKGPGKKGVVIVKVGEQAGEHSICPELGATFTNTLADSGSSSSSASAA